jgi:flagellar export protein FliJ
MSALESLIRLHRWQLDERRRQLADLDTLGEKLRQEQARLSAEERQEQVAASSSYEAASAYGSYVNTLIGRRDRLKQSLVSVEEQIVAARETLAETYREVKRYEIASANRATQQKKRLARQQQRTLDELGIENYRRRGGA